MTETKSKGAPSGATGRAERQTHAPYPREFRAQAVQLVRTGGTSMRQVAKDLGVHEETLRLWVRQADVDAGRRDGLSTGERDELTQLRRRVRVLEEEREILQKAAACFAKESATR